jgi:hypothetical protein
VFKEEDGIVIGARRGSVGSQEDFLRVRGITKIPKMPKEGLLQECGVVTLLVLQRIDFEKSREGVVRGDAFSEDFLTILEVGSLNVNDALSLQFASDNAGDPALPPSFFSAQNAVPVFWREGIDKFQP